MKYSSIHYGDLYSAPSRLLLRSAPDPCTAKEKSFEAKSKMCQKESWGAVIAPKEAHSSMFKSGVFSRKREQVGHNAAVNGIFWGKNENFAVNDFKEGHWNCLSRKLEKSEISLPRSTTHYF